MCQKRKLYLKKTITQTKTINNFFYLNIILFFSYWKQKVKVNILNETNFLKLEVIFFPFNKVTRSWKANKIPEKSLLEWATHT